MMQLETFFTVPEQTRLLIFAVLLGIPLGVVFDVLRTLRLLLPHGKLAAALEDVAFLLLWAGALLCFSTVLARGEFRGYYVMGSVLGFCCTAVRWAASQCPFWDGFWRGFSAVCGGCFARFSTVLCVFALRCTGNLDISPNFFEKHLFFRIYPCREIEKCCIMIVEF